MKTFFIIFTIYIIVNISFAQNYGGWTIADSLIEARESHSSVLLNDTSILVSGGAGNGFWLSTCEIYNPVINEWRQTNSMNIGRGLHQSVLLDNGNVLAIGGHKIKSCEIFNLQTENWTITDSLNIRRIFGYTATLLNNGKVLVIGGYDVPDDSIQLVRLRDCEIYDPNTETWTITDSLHFERWLHTANLLTDGRVLVAGGYVLPAEIYDPITGEWSVIDSMTTNRSNHSSTLLNDGRVLIAGGSIINDSLHLWTNKCEVYDPVTNEWIITGDLQVGGGFDHYGILMNNGLIMFAGGETNVWELFNPSIMQTIHWDFYPFDKRIPTMHLLPDGRIISIGGYSWEGMYIFKTDMCEIYDPNLNAIQDNTSLIPKGIELYQNYPNPFNSETIIQFYKANNSEVIIQIYDITGKLILAEFINEARTGLIHYKWKIKSNLPSGIYFYLIKQGKFSSKVLKAIYLK